MVPWCSIVYNVFIYGPMCHSFLCSVTHRHRNTRPRWWGEGGGTQKHSRTVSAKSRPTTCLLIERKIISCYKFWLRFFRRCRVSRALNFFRLSGSLHFPNSQSSILPLTVVSSTDESLTTKVDTLRRLFRKLMTYNKRDREPNFMGIIQSDAFTF